MHTHIPDYNTIYCEYTNLPFSANVKWHLRKAKRLQKTNNKIVKKDTDNSFLFYENINFFCPKPFVVAFYGTLIFVASLKSTYLGENN